MGIELFYVISCILLALVVLAAPLYVIWTSSEAGQCYRNCREQQKRQTALRNLGLITSKSLGDYINSEISQLESRMDELEKWRDSSGKKRKT